MRQISDPLGSKHTMLSNVRFIKCFYQMSVLSGFADNDFFLAQYYAPKYQILLVQNTHWYQLFVLSNVLSNVRFFLDFFLNQFYTPDIRSSRFKTHNFIKCPFLSGFADNDFLFLGQQSIEG